LLARCWDVLHAFRPDINVVGPATSPRGNDNPNAASNISHSPVSFIKQMGVAFRASGRSERLFDTVGQHVYQNSFRERPFLIHTVGRSSRRGTRTSSSRRSRMLSSGRRNPFQALGATCSCVPIWYLESGFQTVVPPEKAGYYTGTENIVPIPDFAGGENDFPNASPLATSPAPDQATQLGTQSGSRTASRTSARSSTSSFATRPTSAAGSLACFGGRDKKRSRSHRSHPS